MVAVFPRAIIPSGWFSFRRVMVLVTIDEMVVNQYPVFCPPPEVNRGRCGEFNQRAAKAFTRKGWGRAVLSSIVSKKRRWIAG